MPLAFTQIDTSYPPTWGPIWSGVPATGPSVVDSATAVRFTTGENKQNYFHRQRVEGDLFKRDVVVNLLIKKVIDYLATRTGPCVNTPDVTLMPDRYLVIGRMQHNAAQNPNGAYVVGAQVRYVSGTAVAADCSLQIWAVGGGSPLATVQATDFGTTNLFYASDIVDRSAYNLAADTEYEIRLCNANVTNSLVASALFIWCPRVTE